jgi:Zn-dependent protease/CBS domain-containing protein
VRQTLRLGSVAGIRIGANGGVLVIAAIILFGLAAARFPAEYPGRGALAYLTAAAVAVVLFFASLLAHELAHALVAQANGVRVDAITLWLFGGVAQLHGELRSPGADFGVAVVGPATSLVLGGLFGGLAAVLSAAGADGLVVSAAAYLALVNIVLAVFNLLPAAPLDGGRVLRAAIWKATGDRVRAAVIAARAGRGLGFGLILVGVGLVLLTGALSALWWALIGWFLVNAARAEEEYANLSQRLRGVRVADVMSPSPVTVPPEATLAEFIPSTVMHHRFSTYPLTDAEGRLIGLATLNRIRAVPAEDRDRTRLADIACPPDQVPTARPEEPLIELLPRLAGCTDGRAVVVDAADRVIGLVSPSDVSRTLALADLHARPHQMPGTSMPGTGTDAPVR